MNRWDPEPGPIASVCGSAHRLDRSGRESRCVGQPEIQLCLHFPAASKHGASSVKLRSLAAPCMLCCMALPPAQRSRASDLVEMRENIIPSSQDLIEASMSLESGSPGSREEDGAPDGWGSAAKGGQKGSGGGTPFYAQSGWHSAGENSKRGAAGCWLRS